MSAPAPQPPASPLPCRPFHGSRTRPSASPLSPEAQHRLAEFGPRITTVQDAVIDLDWNYLVDGWFLGSEASIVYAPSNLGKSTFVIDLASAVVSGMDWHGYATRRGSVIYVAAESAISIVERAKPLLAAGAAPFHVLDDRLDLFDAAADIEALAALTQALEAKSGEPVALIVVDTLTLCMGRGDENNNGDAGRVVRSAIELAKLTGCHVLLVHHTGKDRNSGPRGASNLVGTADAAVELVAVEKDGEKLVRAIQTKQRRLAKSETITFKIVSKLLGHTSEGKARTVSAIKPVASGELIDLDQPQARPDRAQSVLAAFIALEGATPPEQRMAGFTASEVAEASFQSHGAGMKIDSWKKAVRTALSELAASPSVLLALDGGRYARPPSPAEVKH
jgi:hypothetical protein